MKKAKKEAGPPTIAAYELVDDGLTETIRADNLRRPAADNETDEQAHARSTRLGWARKSLLGWMKAPTGGQTFARVMSDGTKVATTIDEVRAFLDAPDAATHGSEGHPQPGTWEIKASAPIAIADMVPATPPAKATRKRKAPIAMVETSTAPAVIPRAEVVADVMPEMPTHDPLSGLSRSVYTIGYDFGLTPDHLDRLMAALDIATVIDTRANTLARKGWSGQKLRERLGARYRSAQTLDDVARSIAALAPSPSRAVLLLRKETAPGDNAFHLDIAKRVKVTHLWMSEMIDGAALQRALDLDAMDPETDHEYECIKLEDEEAAEQKTA